VFYFILHNQFLFLQEIYYLPSVETKKQAIEQLIDRLEE